MPIEGHRYISVTTLLGHFDCTRYGRDSQIPPFVLRKAGERGRRIHDDTESMLRGEELDEPAHEGEDGFREAARLAISELDMKPILLEQNVECSTLQLHGRLDFFGTMFQTGRLSLCDWKSGEPPKCEDYSSKPIAHPSVCLQTVLYQLLLASMFDHGLLDWEQLRDQGSDSDAADVVGPRSASVAVLSADRCAIYLRKNGQYAWRSCPDSTTDRAQARGLCYAYRAQQRCRSAA